MQIAVQSGISSNISEEKSDSFPSASQEKLHIRVLEHDLLRVFLAVVDSGGYTSAGQLLHRTQAAISQQIQRLEDSTQVALFEHPRRPVRLTQQGNVLLDYARRIIALNDKALSSLRSGEIAGRVRIGASNHYATHVLPSFLAEFSRAHPRVEVEMHTGLSADMQQKLGSSYDIIINSHPPGLGGGHLIRREQLHWITSHHNSPHHNDPLPMAFLPPGSLVRNMAVSALGRTERSWRLVHESSNIASLLASAEAGWALTVFQQSSLEISNVRMLGESDGMPPLPQIEVRMEVAPLFLSHAAAELHRYLLALLVPAK